MSHQTINTADAIHDDGSLQHSRVAEPGTRDLLSLLQRPDMIELLERVVPQVIDGSLSAAGPNAKRTSALLPFIAAIHGPDRPGEAMRAALDGNFDLLERLPDACLAGDLTVPKSYRPSLPLARWVDGLLGTRLAKDLRIDRSAFVEALTRLQHNNDEAWAFVITGHLGSAAALPNLFLGPTAAQAKLVLRSMAILLQAAASMVRAALLRRWGKTPLTEAFSSDCEWQYQARTMRAAIVEPAAQVSRLLAVAGQREAVSLSPFRGSFLEGSLIMKLAEQLATSVYQRPHLRTFSGARARVAADVVRQANKLAGITPQQLKEEGLGRRSFVEARLGASASHSAVIIGLALLTASTRIDRCLEALLAAKPLPHPAPLDFAAALTPGKYPNVRCVVRTVQNIRLAVRTDRAAFSIGARDADDKSGTQMVRSALRLFSRAYPADAVTALAVDPTIWFTR